MGNFERKILNLENSLDWMKDIGAALRNLYYSKNVENTHGEVLSNTLPWVFFRVFLNCTNIVPTYASFSLRLHYDFECPQV